MRQVKQFGGDFGITVRFDLHENGASVSFFAAEVTGRDIPDDNPSYWRKGATSSMDDTTVFGEAERYFDGFVKWDGCSHVSFGDETGYLHICGQQDFQKLSQTLLDVYDYCGVLMKEHGTYLLEGEFEERGVK